MTVSNNANKLKTYNIIAGVGLALFLSTFFLSFPLAIAGVIGIVGYCVLLSFTALGFLMFGIGLSVSVITHNDQVSTPSENIVELSDSIVLPISDNVAPSNTLENNRKRDEREAFIKAESAMLAKYRDVADILNVRLPVPSLRFWQNQTNISQTVPLSLALNLARNGDENYETNSRFSPSCTVAAKVAMMLVDPKNSEIKYEIIAEIKKLDLNNFTQEKKDKLIDTLNRGQELLKYYDEASSRNVEAFCDHLDRTPWSTT